MKLNSHFIGHKKQGDFCLLNSLLLKITAAFCRMDVAPWSWHIYSCLCTHISTCDTGMKEGLNTSFLSIRNLRLLGVNWLF